LLLSLIYGQESGVASHAYRSSSAFVLSRESTHELAEIRNAAWGSGGSGSGYWNTTSTTCPEKRTDSPRCCRADRIVRYLSSHEASTHGDFCAFQTVLHLWIWLHDMEHRRLDFTCASIHVKVVFELVDSGIMGTSRSSNGVPPRILLSPQATPTVPTGGRLTVS